MATPVKITQAALTGFILEWTANDPVVLSFVQRDAAPLDGDYTCHVRTEHDAADPPLAELTVTTTIVDGDFDTTGAADFTTDPTGDHLLVTFSLADSTNVPASPPKTPYVFDAQADAGVTRWAGRVVVKEDVTR